MFGACRTKTAKQHLLPPRLLHPRRVFEGVRAYKTESGTAIFRLAEHTQRLINSGKIYMMDIPYSKDELMEAQKEVVRANKLESCYLRPIAFYGSEKMGISTVAVHSEADRGAMWVRLADESVCIGPAQAAMTEGMFR